MSWRSGLALAAVLGTATHVASAAEWYVDGNVPTGATHDGKSWATAWANPADVSGVAPGDIVNISGGPSGSTLTYSDVVTPGANGDDWHPPPGAPQNPVTYRIGQDAAHDGTALFDGKGTSYFLGYPDYNTNTNVHDVVISGDAGDGKQHFAVTGYDLPVHGDLMQNVRISFVDFGNAPDGPIRLIPSQGGIEIDHCHVVIADLAADHFSQGSFQGTTWDTDSAHDNEIHLPRLADTGSGADGFQWGGSGFSIYHNLIIADEVAYTGSQHQDGFQTLGASYVKIYGNTIVNMANAAIYLDGYGGDFEHVWVYDNLVIGGGVGISGGPDSGALQGLGRWPNFTDVVIANNTTADTWDIEAGIGLGIDPYIEQSQGVKPTTTFTDCVVSNNVVVNAAGLDVDASITSEANVTLAAADAPSHFSSYAPNASTNDFHLAASDTLLRGQGKNLTQYFASDLDGNARPATGAWDVGAYQYCDSGCNPGGTGGSGTGGSNTGGSNTGGTSAAGAGGSSAAPAKKNDSGDSSGCGCELGGRHRDAAIGLLVFAALAWQTRRSRRRRR